MTELLKEWETRTGTHSDLPNAMDRISQAESSRDVKAVMETQGVSERTARRQTKTTRDQQKADRDAEICQRYRDGQSKKQISDKLGIGQATVKRAIDKNTKRISSHQNGHDQLELLIGDVRNGDSPTNTETACVDCEQGGDDEMGTQKQIENRILEFLEKNEFLSGRDFYERMRGIDLKDIYETLQILLRLQYIGTLTTSDGRTLYCIEGQEE